MNVEQRMETQTQVLSPDDLNQLVKPQDERRATPRYAYQVMQRISPVLGNEFEWKERFRKVVCKDISASGISFYLSSEPYFAQLEIELRGNGTILYVAAEVVGSHLVAGLEPYHLVRCRFNGMADR